MNVAVAPALPALPVADGSSAAAGQTAAPATGFDALLALVDAAVQATSAEATPAPASPVAEDADPSAAPSDAMLAALAAMLLPPPAPEAPVIMTAANDVASAPPAAPVVAAPTAATLSAPAAAPATPPSEPIALAEDAGADLAAMPIAAPSAAKTEPQAPAAPLVLAAAAPAAPKEAAQVAMPSRAAAPAAEPAAAPAAKPVDTEIDTAVAAVNTGASNTPSGQDTAQPETPAQPAAPAAGAAQGLAPTHTRAADVPAPIAQAVAEVRGSPETVAKLSADILKKLDGRSTRFEIALDPLGLGRVDVKMEIGAGGQVSASLSFDTAHAAAELRGRASELRHALQQAGFDLPDNALSFDVNSQARDDGRGAQTAWDFQDRGQGRGAPNAGRAFEAVLSGAESLIADLSTRPGAPRADGVDIRI